MTLDLFSAREAAKERQERGSARVQRSPQELELVRLATAYCQSVLSTDGSFTADSIRHYLDQCGIGATDQALRRRISAEVINRGRDNGLWKHIDYVTGLAGRPMSLWGKP